jgi:hypothetical protein
MVRPHNITEIMHPIFGTNGYKIPPIRAVIISGQSVGGDAVFVLEEVGH